jgi:hypothetical protein
VPGTVAPPDNCSATAGVGGSGWAAAAGSAAAPLTGSTAFVSPSPVPSAGKEQVTLGVGLSGLG